MAAELWTLGDAAVDYYFSGNLWRVARRQLVRYLKRKATEKLFDSVKPQDPSSDAGQQSVKISSDRRSITSRINGRRGGRPPYRHLGVSFREPHQRGGYTQRANNRGSQTEAQKRSMSAQTSGPSRGNAADTSGTGSDMDSPEHKRRKRSDELVDSSTLGGDVGNHGQFSAIGALGGCGLRTAETHVVHKQLTFKHYLTYNGHEGWQFKDVNGGASVPPFYGEKVYVNKDWSYLPYNWLCCYMTERDYQGINVAYKRWRVKSFGFDVHHIVPFLDDLTSTGGNVTPSVEISPLTYFEAFCDTEGELPFMNLTEGDLPNEKMKKPFCARASSTLKDAIMYYGNWEGGNDFMQLEQSPGFEMIDAAEGLSYTHHVHAVDQQWRHALLPVNANYLMYKDNTDNHDGFMTTVLGRNNVNSGLLMAKNASKSGKLLPGITGDNLLYDSWTGHFPHSPAPKVLLRVPEVMRSSNTGVPYGFVLHVTYRMLIEAEPNYTIYPALKFSDPNGGNLFRGARERFQPSGGDCHKMIKVGKSKSTIDNTENVGADTN